MKAEFESVTLAESVTFTGIGIHSGCEARAVIHPFDEGIVFVRDGVRTAATPQNVTDTTRSTTLGNVRMVEHLMSSFAGLGITDALVEVEGPELPILDGSAREYCEGLKIAGMSNLARKKSCRVFGRVNINDGLQRIGVSVGTGRWRYEFERDGHWPGCLSAEAYLEGDAYESRVAPARTFAFDDELDQLRDAGLGTGGTKDNTLVIGAEGYLTENRFADEPARHKLLDCIGDIALSGVPVRFLNVVAERTGHRLHVQAAARLAEICKWEE